MSGLVEGEGLSEESDHPALASAPPGVSCQAHSPKSHLPTAVSTQALKRLDLSAGVNFLTSPKGFPYCDLQENSSIEKSK